ncbi:aminotransferase class I/II-fold pyridoxal phosphate-dependent enzyme, partial [Priestia megaterium]
SYTANAGLLELRFEIMKYMKRNFNVSYDYQDDIIVTVGGSQALDITMRALINPEDEIIVVEPNFVSYSPLISLAGGVPVAIETTAETEFKLQPRQIEEVITSNTKALLLCSPNNPTGSSLSKEELQAIADIVIKHDLLVITDEIYAELTYDEEFTSIASLEGMKERTIIISGFSKGFAMTGWRLGYICAPTEIAKAMLKIHQYTMMCAPTMAQYGAIEALQNGQHDVEEMRKSYRRRRNYMVKSLNQIGLECHSPGGAFYVFPSIKKTGLSSEEFAEQLLLEERVAVVPGNVFGKGGEGHIRCSYASSMESLEESIKRISRFVENKL